jgi:hypothetical protein
MISFQTPGLLDLRVITTMGINVKPNTDSPIGYFGTGLKYAIAVILRERGEIKISIGEKVRVTFRVERETVRGKDFDIPYMLVSGDGTPLPPIQLPFTLEFGKNWTLKHAYRELYSNTVDEQGSIWPQERPYGDDFTIISVYLPEFDLIHAERHEFILDTPNREMIFSNHRAQAFLGQSRNIFYRGFAAYTLDKPSLYTYNILETSQLSEDRTFATSWCVRAAIAELIAQEAPLELIPPFIAGKEAFEADLSYSYTSPSAGFIKATINTYKTSHTSDINMSAITECRRVDTAAGTLHYAEIPMTDEQKTRLDLAIDWLTSIGFAIRDYPIILSNEVGDNIIALAYRGKCYLTSRAFESDDLLRNSLLEEYVHLSTSYDDFTRDIQNVLFGQIIRLGGQVLELRKEIRDKETL